MTERRRAAIDEALHELRRPLQALALSDHADAGVVESSTRLAAAALERLEHELDGERAPRRSEPVRCEAVLRSAVGRWRARVALGGGSLELRWRAGHAFVVADAAEFEQAVDNLIVNAIEHGGPQVVVGGGCRGGRLLIMVSDSGRGSGPESVHGAAGQEIARLNGRRRRGHGLPLVRRFAAVHGGRFALRRAGEGSLAILELPLAGAPALSEPAA